MSYTGQALLLVAALYRKGAITLQLKSELKDLVLSNDPLVQYVFIFIIMIIIVFAIIFT